MVTLIFFGVLITLSLICAAIVIISDKAFARHYKRVEARRRAEHPTLYQQFDKTEALGRQMNQLNRDHLVPLRRQIDRLLEGYVYLPDQERVATDIVLEDLRKKYHTHNEVWKILQAEQRSICKWIKEYKKENNIEW